MHISAVRRWEKHCVTHRAARVAVQQRGRPAAPARRFAIRSGPLRALSQWRETWKRAWGDSDILVFRMITGRQARARAGISEGARQELVYSAVTVGQAGLLVFSYSTHKQ